VPGNVGDSGAGIDNRMAERWPPIARFEQTFLDTLNGRFQRRSATSFSKGPPLAVRGEVAS
jgi:hypothetical protein